MIGSHVKKILIIIMIITLTSCNSNKNCIKTHKETICLCAGNTPIKTQYDVCDKK